MLVAIVALFRVGKRWTTGFVCFVLTHHPPVMLDKLESISQDRVDPETSYGWFQISPVPPAFRVMVITTATEVVTTRTARGGQ